MNTDIDKSEENKIRKPITDLLGHFSEGQKTRRDVEILTKMSQIIEDAKNVKCTYRGNEKKSEWMDFFLDGKYIESTVVQPKAFLDFRAAKIDQGFIEGINYALKKMLDFFKEEKKKEDESK